MYGHSARKYWRDIKQTDIVFFFSQGNINASVSLAKIVYFEHETKYFR